MATNLNNSYSDQHLNQSCPICTQRSLEHFFSMSQIPVYCNVLWESSTQAKNCSRSDIELVFCPHCSFIFNATFDANQLDYNPAYENSLHYSHHFQAYIETLAAELIQRYDLHQKTILEIGCGKGDFLQLLCDLGDNQGIGFDPTYVELPDAKKSDRFQVIQDFYSERYSSYQGDFVCCRHTLEHVPNPTALLKTLRNLTLNPSTPIFFEVPNALDIFRSLAIWDIIYEHCCYFTPIALVHAFEASGFCVNSITEVFASQFLCLEAQPGRDLTNPNLGQINLPRADKVAQLKLEITQFASKFQKKSRILQKMLAEIETQGRRIVVWGAGSKGVTFLNLMAQQGQAQTIEYVVDLNPRKQGKYVPGTGQQIVSPSFLQEYQPDVVLVMNSVYAKEINQTLSSLGLNPKVFCS